MSALSLAAQQPATDPAKQPTVWRADLPGDLKGMALTPLGAVLVEIKGGGIAAWDPATGELLWSRPDGSEYFVLAGTGSAVVRAGGGREVIDLANGKTLWKFSTLPLQDPKGYQNVAARIPDTCYKRA